MKTTLGHTLSFDSNCFNWSIRAINDLSQEANPLVVAKPSDIHLAGTLPKLKENIKFSILSSMVNLPSIASIISLQFFLIVSHKLFICSHSCIKTFWSGDKSPSLVCFILIISKRPSELLEIISSAWFLTFSNLFPSESPSAPPPDESLGSKSIKFLNNVFVWSIRYSNSAFGCKPNKAGDSLVITASI